MKLLGPAAAAGLAWLISANLHTDPDTLHHVHLLLRARDWREAVWARREHSATFILESPVIYTVTAAVRAAFPDWNQLTTYRLLTWSSVVATAAILVRAARAVGGSGGTWIGPGLAFTAPGVLLLVLDLDDNVLGLPFRLMSVIILGRAVGALTLPWPNRRPGPVAVGLIFGLAMAWHLQAAVLLPLIPLAWMWLGDGPRAVERTMRAMIAVALAIAVYLVAYAMLVACYPLSGAAREAILAPTGLANLGAGLAARLIEPGARLAEAWTGARATFGLVPALEPEWQPGRVFIWTGVLLLLGVHLHLATAACALREGRFLFSAVSLQSAHSLFYEANNPERWDLCVVLAALMACAAGKSPRRPRRRLIPLAVVLQALSSLALVVRLGWQGPEIFGRAMGRGDNPRSTMGVSWHCFGAHRELAWAARELRRVAPESVQAAFIVRTSPDRFLQYNLQQWTGTYVAVYVKSLGEGFLRPNRKPAAYQVVISLGFPPTDPGPVCRPLIVGKLVAAYRCPLGGQVRESPLTGQ